jgi:hypothetical protein
MGSVNDFFDGSVMHGTTASKIHVQNEALRSFAHFQLHNEIVFFFDELFVPLVDFAQIHGSSSFRFSVGSVLLEMIGAG